MKEYCVYFFSMLDYMSLEKENGGETKSKYCLE